jgi:hypothetical protein
MLMMAERAADLTKNLEGAVWPDAYEGAVGRTLANDASPGASGPPTRL